MATLSVRHPQSGKHLRIERRSRRRTTRATSLQVLRTTAWCLVFVALGWLVAAGAYGLLVSG